MLFVHYFIKKFSFNQGFRSKTPCGFTYRADFCWLAAFPPPPTATQPPHLDVGEYAAAVRDRLYCLTHFSGFGLF